MADLLLLESADRLLLEDGSSFLILDATTSASLLNGNVLSLADQSIESGISNWNNDLAGTGLRVVTASQDIAYDGTGSLLMTRALDGTGMINTYCTAHTAAPGDRFAPYAWVYTVFSGLTVCVNFEWKLSGAWIGGSYMSAVAIPPETWTLVTGTPATLPSGINQMGPEIEIWGTTATGQGAYFDLLYYGPPPFQPVIQRRPTGGLIMRGRR